MQTPIVITRLGSEGIPINGTIISFKVKDDPNNGPVPTGLRFLYKKTINVYNDDFINGIQLGVQQHINNTGNNLVIIINQNALNIMLIWSGYATIEDFKARYKKLFPDMPELNFKIINE